MGGVYTSPCKAEDSAVPLQIPWHSVPYQHGDNPNTTQTLEYTKDKYNAKIRNKRVSPKVQPTTYIGQRVEARRCKEGKGTITREKSMTFRVDDF
jgi:hypothetical protein